MLTLSGLWLHLRHSGCGRRDPGRSGDPTRRRRQPLLRREHRSAPVLYWRVELSWLAVVGVPPCHGTARAGFGVRLPLPAWSCAVAAGGTVSRWAASMRSEHVSGFSVLEPSPLYPLWVIGVRAQVTSRVRPTREHVSR